MRIQHRKTFECDVSLDELAIRFGVSKARVLQLEINAIRKLRRAITAEARAAGMSIDEWLDVPFTIQTPAPNP